MTAAASSPGIVASMRAAEALDRFAGVFGADRGSGRDVLAVRDANSAAQRAQAQMRAAHGDIAKTMEALHAIGLEAAEACEDGRQLLLDLERYANELTKSQLIAAQELLDNLGLPPLSGEPAVALRIGALAASCTENLPAWTRSPEQAETHVQAATLTALADVRAQLTVSSPPATLKLLLGAGRYRQLLRELKSRSQFPRWWLRRLTVDQWELVWRHALSAAQPVTPSLFPEEIRGRLENRLCAGALPR